MSERLSTIEPTPIDFRSALERIGGDEAFLRDLIDLYMEDFREKASQIQGAIEKEEFNLIRELGHSLKGSSGNLSLHALQEISYELEISGKQKDLDLAKKSFGRLQKAFNHLKEFLSL